MKDILEVRTNAAHWDSGQPDTHYGIKWNFETMQPEKVDFGYTRPEADPNPNPLAKNCYNVWKHNRHVDAEHRIMALDTSNSERCSLGDTVRVCAGALAPRGMIGEIVRVINSNYGVQFIIRDSKNEGRVYAKNCEVLSVHWRPAGFTLRYKEYPEVSELEKIIYS